MKKYLLAVKSFGVWEFQTSNNREEFAQQCISKGMEIAYSEIGEINKVTE